MAEPAMTTLPERTVEAVADRVGPHIDIRCAQCGGTGNDLRSNLDCTRCGATGYDIRSQPWRDAQAREVATDALDAAMDPALGPDRLVVAGEYEREVRADQTRRIAEFVRTARAGTGICNDEGAWIEAAEAIEREFGGGDAS